MDGGRLRSALRPAVRERMRATLRARSAVSRRAAMRPMGGRAVGGLARMPRPTRIHRSWPAPPSPPSPRSRSSRARGSVPATPPIVPGASAPRARSTSSPATTRSPRPTVDLVPGETVLLHVVNGGLEVHEAVIGDQATQDAWEVAEAAVAEHPPGPTPTLSVPPERRRPPRRGPSGERVDVVWTVPPAVAAHRGSSVATSPVTTRRGWSSPCGSRMDPQHPLRRPLRAPDRRCRKAAVVRSGRHPPA